MAIKNIFLDGIGEHPSSPRRSSMNGLQTRYTLRGASLLGPSGGGVAPGQGQGQGQQSEAAARDVEMVLMDQRWYRETMPCSRRRAA
jgi:alkaline phosphatase D